MTNPDLTAYLALDFAHYQASEMAGDSPDLAATLAELARVKALFQARAIAAVLGAGPPDPRPFLRNCRCQVLQAEDSPETPDHAKGE